MTAYENIKEKLWRLAFDRSSRITYHNPFPHDDFDNNHAKTWKISINESKITDKGEISCFD